MKILDDKYYTPPKLASKLITLTFKVLFKHNKKIKDIIEPSAGNGSFSKWIPCSAYDIKPERKGIKKADFLALPLKYKKGRLCIGNPPFGYNNTLSLKFFKRCIEIGDYIAFIQPISQLNNTLQMYEFDLVYSKDLGNVEYSGRVLRCCFNIYIRPKNGLNSKPEYKTKTVILKEYRRNGSYKKPKGYDFGICTWGNGSFGKESEYVGQYAQEVYFFVKGNKKYKKKVRKLISNLTPDSIAAKRISVSRLYKWLLDHGIK